MPMPILPDSAYEPSMDGPSAAEQLLLELVNRARADPQAEVARIGTAEGALAPGVSGLPLQALAPVQALDAASQGHADAMIAQDFFAHTNPYTGLSPFQRMAEEGYARYFVAGENISLIGGTSLADITARVEAHHRNLWESDSHQSSTLRPGFSETGVGLALGDYNGWAGSTAVSQTFGDRGFAWLTGVVIADGDGDAFYDIGEGLGGVRITAWNTAGDAVASVSFAAGGYAVRLDPGTWTVRFEGGALADPFETSVTIGQDNVKLDVIAGEPGPSGRDAEPPPDAGPVAAPPALAAFLAAEQDPDGFAAGRSRGDRMAGTTAADRLDGGGGRDILRGRQGDDFLSGGSGRDTILGAGGDDVISGNRGNDRLTGGAGADVFVFRLGDGSDRIEDFDVAQDMLAIGGMSAEWRLTDNAVVVADALIVTLGDVTIRLDGVRDALAVDYTFFGESA